MPLHGFAFEAVPHAPHLADLPLLEALHRALPEQAIAEVVAATGAQEQRRRLLPARLVVALVVALGLWACASAIRRPGPVGTCPPNRPSPKPASAWGPARCGCCSTAWRGRSRRRRRPA